MSSCGINHKYIGFLVDPPCIGATYKLELATRNVGHVHVVGRRRQIFELLASKDVNGSQVDLGVTVLSSLGGRHVDDLAGTVLDDNEAVLTESGTLHRVCGRSTGIGAVKGVLMLCNRKCQQSQFEAIVVTWWQVSECALWPVGGIGLDELACCVEWRSKGAWW